MEIIRKKNLKNIKKHTALLNEVKDAALYYGYINDLEKQFVGNNDGEYWMDIFQLGEIIASIFVHSDREAEGWTQEYSGAKNFFDECYTLIKEEIDCSFLEYRLGFGVFIMILKSSDFINKEEEDHLIVSLTVY